MAKYFLATVFFIISFAPFTPTYACSGGTPTTLNDQIHSAETVVQGMMEYVDAEGQNGILNVETILAGARVPKRIVLAIYPPANFRRANERFNSGGCWIGIQPLPTQETIIIFLKRLPNGTYELAEHNRLNPAYYAFPNANAVVNVFYTEENDPLVMSENYQQPSPTKPFTLPEFAELITELASASPLNPLLTAPPPLPTSLYIRTINGTEYELPVDFSSPIRLDTRLADVSGKIERTGCSTVNCIATSPNGVDSAQVMPDGTVQMVYFANGIIPGNAFEFSTTSDALVVWNNNTLTLYALPYDRLGFCCFEMTFINSIGISSSDNLIHVAWSPDGRQIAYSDTKGLYLWDAFDVGSPSRLLETVTSIPVVPRFFSATGRYLAVQRGEARVYIDMVNGAELPDGALSPDDRILLGFDTWQPSPLTLYHLAPLREQVRNERYDAVRQVQWIDQNRYVVANCPPQQPEECLIWKDSLKIGRSYFKGFSFTYERITDTLAIAQRNERISIVSGGYIHQTYDLSASLDSEIQAIYWMPPVFYQP